MESLRVDLERVSTLEAIGNGYLPDAGFSMSLVNRPSSSRVHIPEPYPVAPLPQSQSTHPSLAVLIYRPSFIDLISQHFQFSPISTIYPFNLVDTFNPTNLIRSMHLVGRPSLPLVLSYSTSPMLSSSPPSLRILASTAALWPTYNTQVSGDARDGVDGRRE
ncbi:hypothetical protein JAAARDRAFT_62348 [Jaapia argillacea MUCL 33604]|uniref:Uncharacterized protein n=1 Tax=Jaapia argillacea MUCL 33604 TaxID=933084 RepID=A0A067PKT2_9AGAM|nr:hypothetical protein JAAARDRAFT_62348 [Jaapia argillacea MUCL 33604]